LIESHQQVLVPRLHFVVVGLIQELGVEIDADDAAGPGNRH